MSEVLTRGHLDSSEKKIIFESVQDVEPILEHNKALRGMAQKSDWGRHVASIPNIVLTKWLHEEHLRGNYAVRLFSEDFDKIVAKKLRDPEWAYLRVDK